MMVTTWNTYMAPTMWGRHGRRRQILDKVIELGQNGTDILCLQELNSFRTGLFGKLYQWLLDSHISHGLHYLSKYRLIRLMLNHISRILDALAAFEGLFFPLFIFDNQSFVISGAKETFPYHVAADWPQYGVGTGLVILSKTPITRVHAQRFHNDLFRTFPGILIGRTEKLTVATLHLTPILSNNTLSYITANLLANIIFGDNDKTQLQQITELSCMAKQYEIDVIAGDFNIPAGSQMYRQLVRKLKHSYHHYQLNQHTCPVGDTEIDLIFVRSTNKSAYLTDGDGSDHHPVTICLA
jgi:endonuclease/exonuclease/phosphatase family metal-dependent hydrolase